MASPALVLAGIGALAALYILTPPPRPPQKDPHTAYILHCTVVHARLKPSASAHAFTYPLLALLLPLRALEAHALDCARGWVFGYGGLAGRLAGVRPAAYLSDTRPGDRRGIHAKLLEVLAARGLDGSQFGDAWMLTMPSYLGFEGINPLTVYFCYKPSGELWLVTLEIHNTFGERHVHVLEIGKAEDPAPAAGFDHQWTFRREFHVSPFNDRSGFYTVSAVSPRPPSSFMAHTSSPPLPAVRIHLHTADKTYPTYPPTPGVLKLTASLRAVRSEPLNTRALVRALARKPFILLLAMVRILYQAWILHYVKRLDVFPWPAPAPADANWNGGGAGGVGWQHETSLEKYARARVEAFLRRRARAMGVNVALIAADPAVRTRRFGWARADDADTLTVWYIGPQFFTTLFLAPSTRHAVLLGGHCEDLFVWSDAALFDAIFSSDVDPSGAKVSFAQRLRARSLPAELRNAPGYEIPPWHVLDGAGGLLYAVDAAYVCVMLGMNWLEKHIYRLARVRFVAGKEPWLRWARAAERLLGDEHSRWGMNGAANDHGLGSVRRD